MSSRNLNKHIILRKQLLNFLLNYCSPTNRFIVLLSQNLDMLVSKRQRLIYNYHKKKCNSTPKVKPMKKVA